MNYISQIYEPGFVKSLWNNNIIIRKIISVLTDESVIQLIHALMTSHIDQ